MLAAITGTLLAVARQLERNERGDVVLVLEVRRYERWVVDALDAARERAAVVAITDSVVAPVADGAKATFVVDAAGPGPFDSHVAALALGNALVAEVAARLRRTATPRLDAVEAVTSDLLVD